MSTGDGGQRDGDAHESTTLAPGNAPPLGLVAVDVAVARQVDAAAPRPDIVVIYTDDFSPLVQRLWSQPSRTPALARFVEQGIRLEASVSTPLCCPARANLLTGRYGHRNGVTLNRMNGYDARRPVASS